MADFPFKPKVVGWELTKACNFRCLHCGSYAGEPHKDELTLQEGLALCRNLADLKCEVLTLSGGEPLLHPHWDEYAKALSSYGIRVYMITNGYFLEENIDRILASPLRRLGLSIDGLQSTHNYIRDNPRAFQKAMLGVKLLKEKGLTVGAVTHISKMNIKEMQELYDYFLTLHLDFWQIQITFLSGRMKEHEDFISNPEDMITIAKFIEKVRKAGKMVVDGGDNLGYYSRCDITAHPWKGCFAGRWLMGIEAEGSVKGCLSLPRELIEGNVRKRPLKEIWEDPQLFKYNRYFNPQDLQGNCSGCDKGSLCRAGCKVTAYSSTGSFFNNPYCLYRVEKHVG
jgi:radical SAM protein with 4Fe4S-binding SPASM domain